LLRCLDGVAGKHALIGNLTGHQCGPIAQQNLQKS
jgi:hypothetical protein